MRLTPREETNDLHDRGWVHPELSRESGRGFPGRVARADLGDVGLGELRVGVLRSYEMTAAALGHLVIVVVLMRAQEQVRRVHARPVVTAVQDAQVIRNRTVFQLEGDAMGWATGPLPSVDAPVAFIVLSTNPHPALVSACAEGLRGHAFAQAAAPVRRAAMAATNRTESLKAVSKAAREVDPAVLTRSSNVRFSHAAAPPVRVRCGQERAGVQALARSVYFTPQRLAA